MSFILDLIFPRPYQNYAYFGHPAPQPVRYFDNSPLDASLSVFKYRGSIRRLVSDIKYRFVSDACFSLATYTADKILVSYPSLVRYWHDNNFTIIPIPLHSRRQRWRGFNQSYLISQVIASKLNLNLSHFLYRTHYSPPQVSLADKRLRRHNQSHNFATASPVPRNIIIIDDVATTHSTLLSAASTLRGAGARSIWGLTVAGSH